MSDVTGIVYGPDGLRLGIVSSPSRAVVADRAREMGGVQVLAECSDGSRECWTTGEVGGAWRRAWRLEGPLPARGGPQEGAAATGRARDGLDDKRASTGLEGAR